jgi:hypothetical protein
MENNNNTCCDAACTAQCCNTEYLSALDEMLSEERLSAHDEETYSEL